MSYSPTVRRLVAELPNRGRLDGAAFARAENPVCPDTVELYLRIEGETVSAARFQADGCPAAIASAAAVTEIVAGKTRREALDLSVEQLVDYLGGLPEHKRHGAEIAVRALREAVSTGARTAGSQRQSSVPPSPASG